MATPRLNSFLMVPLSSSEILFLGGGRDLQEISEVSLLNLTDLEMKVLIEDNENGFLSRSNSYNISKAGEVTAVVNRTDSENSLYWDLISYSRT